MSCMSLVSYVKCVCIVSSVLCYVKVYESHVLSGGKGKSLSRGIPPSVQVFVMLECGR